MLTYPLNLRLNRVSFLKHVWLLSALTPLIAVSEPTAIKEVKPPRPAWNTILVLSCSGEQTSTYINDIGPGEFKSEKKTFLVSLQWNSANDYRLDVSATDGFSSIDVNISSKVINPLRPLDTYVEIDSAELRYSQIYGDSPYYPAPGQTEIGNVKNGKLVSGSINRLTGSAYFNSTTYRNSFDSAVISFKGQCVAIDKKF
jgi:hypothetical protein